MNITTDNTIAAKKVQPEGPFYYNTLTNFKHCTETNEGDSNSSSNLQFATEALHGQDQSTKNDAVDHSKVIVHVHNITNLYR